MPTLNVNAHILAFSDADTGTSQPRFRNVDWAPGRTQLPINAPINREFDFGPAETKTIFNGQRTLTIDGTTAFGLTLNPVKSGVYRLTATAGTAPGFRTARAIDLTGELVTAAVNNNATMEFTLDGASVETFAGAVVGDTVFIPDLTTGDASASPFNLLNTGFWTVLAVATRKLTCVRPQGTTFQGVSEGPITPAAGAEFQVFSAGPVQTGDALEISAGFSAVSQKTYQITAATATWIEFVSGQSLPLEAAIIPTAAGINIYNDAQDFLYIETDQEASIRINGAAGDLVRASPQRVNDLDSRSMFMLTGTTWRLDIVNLNPAASMTALVIAARMQA